MSEPRATRGLLGRTVAGTVGAARRRVEGEVAGTAQGVIEDLEPYLVEETIPRVLDALEPHLVEQTVPRVLEALEPHLVEQTVPRVLDGLEPHLVERTVPRVLEALVPHLVDSVVPAVVDGLTEHLATRTVPDVLERATPVLASELVPDLLEQLRPYLETELAPALVDALTPHLVQVTAPQLVSGLMPLINAEVVPAVLDGVADDPRIRALVREQSWGLATDAAERFRRLLAAGDDAVERVLRRVLRRRRPVVDPLPPERLPVGRNRSHAGMVSRGVGGGLDIVLASWLGGQALAAGFAVVETLLGSVPTPVAVVLSTLAYLLLPTYLAVAWRTAGTSLGGFVAGYSVTGRDGALMGSAQAAVRAFVGVPLAVLWAFGLLLGITDPFRRGLLERMTGSRTPYRAVAASAVPPERVTGAPAAVRVPRQSTATATSAGQSAGSPARPTSGSPARPTSGSSA